MTKNILATILLVIILLYAGILRFTGQNWDDFTYTHPDERFLTLNLLPQVGGRNEYTPDEKSFPSQKILVPVDAVEIRTRYDIQNSTTATVGAVRDTFSYDVALWLAGRDRVVPFDNQTMALTALQAYEIDSLIVSNAENPTGTIVAGDTLTSQEVQSFRCSYLYPETDGVGGFFDAHCSNLNPHQAGQGFYTYGTFPLFLAHVASNIIQSETIAGNPVFDWQGGHLVWRGQSMLFDMLSVLVVFAIGTRLHNKWVGLLAAVLYASAPLAIQKAHFGTVNASASFLTTFALYCAVVVQQRGKYWAYIVFGIACGAAVATRINVAPLAGVIVLAALVNAMPVFDTSLTTSQRARIFAYHFIGLILAGLGAFLAFRIFNPYAFEGPGFFGIIPNSRWIENIGSGSYGVSGHQDSPPNWQWLARPPYIYPLKDMLLWSMGLGFGVMAWFGVMWSGYRLIRIRKSSISNILPLVWVGVYFAWMGRIWVMTPRYYLPIYGALAVLAGWAVIELYQHAQRGNRDLPITRLLMALFGVVLGTIGWYQALNGIADATTMLSITVSGVLLVVAILPILQKQRAILLGLFVVTFSVLWGVMFGNIYRNQTTLVQSSRYIFERVPGDFAMQIDGTDESVPLINLAVVNNGYYGEANSAGSLLERATLYTENVPVQINFTVPLDGTISSVYAPHLGDPVDDSDPERIEIRIRTEGISLPIGEAILETNLSRDTHPLGEAYEIPFNVPVQVEAGKTYSFEVVTAIGSGEVIGSGSVVLTEGDWDNRVTSTQICQLPDNLTLADNPASGLVGYDECQGTQPWFALINSYDQSMSYPVDNQIKYDDILNSLDLGDYLTIASNRFYDTESRNRVRWPLTSLYYDKLFAEELGYELVGVFDETFEFGPLRVSDQHLPIYDSPSWLNELEADEAFHVYDHPAVFIFRKTEAYSRAKVEAIFSQVSLLQIQDITNVGEQAEMLGVINWPSIEADEAPTALMLPPDAYETQTQGGTWSERFFSESIINTNQVLGVIVWYLTILGFGLLAFPLVFSLFPNMGDGGYGVSKLVGLLLVGWFAWAVSSLKIPLWSQTGVIVSLGVLALLSFSTGYRNRIRLGEFLRANWKKLAWIEVLALSAFLLMIVVRLTNPDLWHYGKGGEKPMDFAYLNGVLRSMTFPPIDPWFAGGYINYYYFGYVLLGSPALLLGVVPAFAYNLMIPTVFMMTGIGAFSSAFNIVAFWRERPSHAGQEDSKSKRRLGNPWVAGIMALLMCVVLGNLDTIRVVGNGIAQLGGYETPIGLDEFLIDEFRASEGYDPLPEERFALLERAAENNIVDRLRYEIHNSLSLVSGMVRGFASALGGNVLPIGHDRWYWGPSRVLAETRGVEGNAITEMPYFTFLYGDLHAHMINMPVILLTVLFLFNELAQVGQDRRGYLERFLALALGAMAVGLMQAINTWDWPSMTLFAVIGLSYVWWLRWQDTFRSLQGGWMVALSIVILGVGIGVITLMLTQIDTDLSVVALAGALRTFRLVLIVAIGLLVGWVAIGYFLVRASTIDLLANVGGFLVLSMVFVLPYSSWYAATYNSVGLWQGGKTPLWAYFDIHGLFLFLIVSLLIWETARWLRDVRVSALRGRQTVLNISGVTLLLGGLVTLAMGMMGYQVALIVIPLIAWIALLFFRPAQSRSMRYVLVLIGLALSMTLGVEIIVIGGDIGRQNTVFKFYIQAWLLFSVAGGVAVAWLVQSSDYWLNRLRMVWYTPFLILFIIAGLYPIMATRARALDRMAPDIPLTLNGLDYMTASSHYETDQLANTGEVIDLSVDHELIRWMQENVEGSPVIMEGRSYPSEYHWNGRFAITTGLPSVLGWNFHQKQQRTFDPLPRWVDQRDTNIRLFYDTPDIDVAVDMLHHYDVKYIISSGLERVQTDPEGLEKFDRMVDQGLLSVAYATIGGTIYQVNEDALMQYLVERNS